MVAWPAACVVLAALGRRRPEPIALDPSAFITAPALSLLIAVVTVVGVAWTAARTSPGDALRQD